MKHIRRKITVSVLGTMLFVFAVLLATVNIFIPEYLTSEARKAILLEDERKDPVPLTEITDEGEEHFLASSVRYLEVEEGLTESEHLSKAEYQLRKYCREEKPAADEFHTLKTGGSRFVFRISQVEADEYEDAYSYILYVDVGAVMQYSAYLNAAFFAVLAVLSVLVCLFGWKLGGYVEKAHESQKWFFQNVSHELKTPMMAVQGHPGSFWRRQNRCPNWWKSCSHSPDWSRDKPMRSSIRWMSVRFYMTVCAARNNWRSRENCASPHALTKKLFW